MRNVTIVQYAHLGSKRVPNKLLLPIKGTTLLQHGFSMLKNLNVDVIIVCPYNDDIIINTAKQYNFHVIPLTQEEGNSENWLEYIKPVASYPLDWIWLSNIICRPFLKLSTAETILKACMTMQRPFVTTLRERGSIYNDQGQLEHGFDQLANTKTNQIYHRFAHLGYGLPSASLSVPEQVLHHTIVPFPIELSWREKIDIDTLDDVDQMNSVIGEGN